MIFFPHPPASSARSDIMNDIIEQGTDEQQQALRKLVHLGFGAAIVTICNSLQIDGGWLENLVLDEMLADDRVV